MASEAGEPPQAGTPVVTPTLELQASDTPASDANEDTAAISPDATEPEERRGPFHRPFFVSLRGPHHSSTKNYLDREQQGEQSDRQTRLQEARTTVGRKSRLLFWKSSPAEEVAAAPKDPQKLLYMEAVSAYQNVRAAQQEAYNQMIEEQKYWKREGAPRQQARERRDITVARLTKEAQLRADEEALTREQTQTKLAEQAADMERRKRKKDEQTRRNRETQRQIREQIARERAEKEEEDRQKQIKDAELLAMQRKAKAESDAMKAEQEAKHTAHKEAEVMARFKASEEERTRVRACAPTLNRKGAGVGGCEAPVRSRVGCHHAACLPTE